MIHYHHHKPKILFVGINPHPGSFRRGIPFSNNKMFWYLLAQSGLIKETRADLRDDTKLKKIYDNKFNKIYRLGFVNVINRPTKDITELKRGEENPGRKRIKKIVIFEKPPIICFIGKIAYAKYTGKKRFGFGWQEKIENSRTFVMHFPLHGKALIRVNELKKLKKY